MATMPSSASILPWMWVIETLASSKKVDAPLLIDLVKRTPEISDDLGKNAREMVSLRIMESLFTQGTSITCDAASAPDSKIGIDPSDCCEDVLRSLLHETSASDLKKCGPEMLKWDVQPFLAHKRSCLPKCALQQLKDVIVEGNHPLLVSLKKRSGLEIRNQDEIRITLEDGESNGVARRLEGSSTDGQKIAANGNLMSLSPENGDDLIEEKLSNRNSLPTKRVRTVLTAENLEEQSVDYDFNLHSNSTKKLKQDATSARKAVGQNADCLLGTEQVEDSSGRSVQPTGREGCDFLKELQVRGLEESMFSEDGHDEESALKSPGQSGDVDDADFLHNQKKIPCTGNIFPEDKSGDRQGQNMSIDEAQENSEGLADMRASDRLHQDVNQQKISSDGAKDDCEQGLQPNAPSIAPLNKVNDDVNHNCELEMSSDSDGYHDDRIDIATKKNTFLSSQCTQSQDSLLTGNFSELNLCMKCNEGDCLLACSSDACPLVVHEKCLGSAASFDGSGKFYCPFCAYSRAISGYLEVKKKASLARKDMAAFIGLGTEKRPKKFSKRLRRSVQETNSRRNYVNEVSNSLGQENMDDKQQAKSSVSCINDNPPCGEKDLVAISETLVSLRNGKQVGENMVQQCGSPRGLEELQTVVQPVCDSEADNSSRRDTQSEMQRGVLHQPVTAKSDHPACPTSSDSEENSEEENDKSIASNYSIRFRKRDVQ
ncbi:unnamed protein product [Ilex paraguariensis]